MVGFFGAIDRRPAAPQALHTGAGQRPFACGEQRREVGRHAAAGERALRHREADELGDPSQGLLLDKVRGTGGDGEVRVVGRRERGGKYPDLQAGRADVAEVERARGRDARVQDARRVLKCVLRVAGLLGERLFQARGQSLLELRLGGARGVE